MVQISLGNVKVSHLHKGQQGHQHQTQHRPPAEAGDAKPFWMQSAQLAQSTSISQEYTYTMKET